MKKILAIFFLIALIFTSSNSFSQIPSYKKFFINGGVSGPVADMQGIYEYGPSLEAGFVFFTPPLTNLDFMITVGYNPFKYVPDNFNNQVRTLTGAVVTNFTPDWKATDVPVMLGARLRFPTLNLIPYVTAEAGAHFMNFNQRFNGNTITVNGNNPASVDLTNVTETSSETAFGMSLGIGLEISVSSLINLDIGGKYNYAGINFSKLYKVTANGTIFTSNELNSVQYVTGRAGIIFKF